MATRFTRVTIAGDDRQVDVSLPASAPVAEQLPMVLRLLSVPTTPVPRRWVLSTPELGVLARDRSLDDSGILDGMVLFLTEAPEAAAPPFVDDVEAAAAETVAEIAPAFTDEYRRSGIAGLMALILLAACWVSLTAPSPIGWLGACIAGVTALAVGALVAERGGSYVAAMAVPAAATLVYSVQPRPDGVTAADLMLILTAASLALIAVGLVRQASAVTAAGITATLLAVASWVGLYAGLPAYRMAGLVVVITVLSSGLAGQFALGGAGLVNLMVADERGEKVPRLAVDRALRRGQAIATGVVWASAVGAGVAVLVLIRTQLPIANGWISPVFGVLAAAVFGLRSRMFSRTKQVVPMLGVAVVGAIGVATMLPAWVSMTNVRAATAVALGLLALAAVLLGATGFSRMAEVPRARIRRLLEGLEFVTVLALLPGLILLFDVITAMKRALG
ncbi:type VII secretion integral membrane protein EccD [Nakamurella lactea]|uniref:type VII secretion integral membrane protein EccD n=1 Tax=Nakamurella lactea TaxID=459515 RepID=UPI00040E87BF|nr:type VII secretion integral membrane protein EccD [Nakamurella lactea]